MSHFTNHIILVNGTGCKVGKTTLACRIIKYLAKVSEVQSVKITSHFHTIGNETKVVYQNDEFMICKEHEKSTKDSSRMLQAGASPAYFVQCKKEAFHGMWIILSEMLSRKKLTVIESGTLSEHISPSLVFSVMGEGDKSTEIKNRKKSFMQIFIQSDDVDRYLLEPVLSKITIKIND